MKKTIGIVGCGAVTQNNYVKALSMYQNVEVKYVCDLDANLAQTVATLLNAKVTDKQTLFKEVDIVIICTPPSTHYNLVKEAVRKGITIICEKPFVPSLVECNDLINITKEGGATLYVAHFRRVFPSVQLAKSLVSSGLLGKILSIEAYEGGKFSWATTSGYVYKDPFGGVLFDTGSHTIDMALFISGLDLVELSPEVIKIKKDKEEPAHEVEATLKLNYKDSSASVMFKSTLSRRMLMSNKIKVIGENGFVEVPTVLANYIRIGGKLGSEVVYTNVEYADVMDCFALQFKDMFSHSDNSVFVANRFGNLTSILETIAKS